nr:hypothetical protein [Tanacetum cinerariifolium]
MPLGYRAAMDRWRAAPPSTSHPLLPLELPSSSSPSPSLYCPYLETMTLRARVELLEHHDVVTQESLRIARGMITRSELRAVYDEQERTDMTEKDIVASCARVVAAEQQAETLQVSLGAARMDVRDLIES